jgi:hypothetical protein
LSLLILCVTALLWLTVRYLCRLAVAKADILKLKDHLGPIQTKGIAL